MAKVLKILTIFLIPVFLNSTALLSCSLKSEILLNAVELTSNKCALDGESNEQNEEQNEGENDIYSYAFVSHKCYLEKGVCFNYASFLFAANIIDYYSPPPEMII